MRTEIKFKITEENKEKLARMQKNKSMNRDNVLNYLIESAYESPIEDYLDLDDVYEDDLEFF